MRKSNWFLANQIARFGAMTIHQMELACASKCGRATVYRMLNDLLKKDLVKRIPQINEAKFLYVPSPDLNALIYDGEIKKGTGFSESRQFHAFAVADTLLELSKYSFVSGITTEFEIESSEVSQFCYSKTPDGVIQITNKAHSFEMAVEVEMSRKIAHRIDELLEKYRITFMKGMPCGALLIVTKDQTLADAYQSKIEKLPKDIQDRCLVITKDKLSTLNQKYFGEYKECPQSSLDKIATWYKGSPKFSSIDSKNYKRITRTIDPYIDGE